MGEKSELNRGELQMKCFYHKDADGKCSGYWISKLMSADEYGSEYIGIDYKMKFPMEIIERMKLSI